MFRYGEYLLNLKKALLSTQSTTSQDTLRRNKQWYVPSLRYPKAHRRSGLMLKGDVRVEGRACSKGP